MRWKATAKGLLLEGIGIHEGVFTGIDGHTVLYPADVLAKALEQLPNLPVKLGHGDDAKVVGYVSAAMMRGTEVWIQAKIFDPEAIQSIKNGDVQGFSAEVAVYGSMEGDVYLANDLDFKAFALVSQPAAPRAMIMKEKVVTLQRKVEKDKEEVHMASIEECVKQLKEKGWDKLSEDCKKKLKEAGYPYPQPTAAEESALAQKVTELVDKIKELEAQIAEKEKMIKQLQGELQKRDEETRNHLLEEVKALGLPVDVDKVLEPIEDLRKQIEVLQRLKENAKPVKTENAKVELEAPKEEPEGIKDEEIDSFVKSLFGGR